MGLDCMKIQLDLMISQLDFLFLGYMPGSLGEHMMYDTYENCFMRAHPSLKEIDEVTGKAPMVVDMMCLTRDLIPEFVRATRQDIIKWSGHLGYRGAKIEDRVMVKMAITEINFIEEVYFPQREHLNINWDMPLIP